MTNLRLIVQYAIPVVTGILGLLWLFGRKKGRKRSIADQPQEDEVVLVDTQNPMSLSEDSVLFGAPANMETCIIEQNEPQINSTPPPTIETSTQIIIKEKRKPETDQNQTKATTEFEENTLKNLNCTERNESVKDSLSVSISSETSENSISVSGLCNSIESSPLISREELLNTSEKQESDIVSAVYSQIENMDLNNSNIVIQTVEELDKIIDEKHILINQSSCSNPSDDSSNCLNLSPVPINSDNTVESIIESSRSSLTLSSNEVKAPEKVDEELTSQVEQVSSSSHPDEDKCENDEQESTENSPLSSDSPGCDSNSEGSNDSGRGGSVTEQLSALAAPEVVRYEFNFPSELCGRLIGRHGRNINAIKEEANAMVALQNNPYTPEFQICVVEGSQSEVEKALSLIRQKFPRSQFSQLDMSPINQPVASKPAAPILMPNIMQLSLPEGVSVDIVVSSIVDAGHVFIQQPTHPSFPSLDRLNQFMIMCYTQDKMVPPLPQPIEVGVICVAPVLDGWYRAQVVQVYDDASECDIKFVDYGGFERLPMSQLKQIRSDFMTLPFQAVESYVANITPLHDEDFFSNKAAAELEELTQGKILQAQVISRAEDGVPYIHIYQITGNRVLFVNRELVNRKVTRGIEIMQ